MMAKPNEEITEVLKVRRVSDPGSAIGEAVGKLLEVEIMPGVRRVAEGLGYYLDAGGPRPGVRKGKELRLKDAAGNEYRLNGLVEDAAGRPVLLIESKYLRYKKHNRDKGSWLVAAHINLRKTYPSLRKMMAILAGNWSAPSKRFIRSFGLEVHEIPFSTLVEVLAAYRIPFDWDEKDRATPTTAWHLFQELSPDELEEIAINMTESVKPAVEESVLRTLTADPQRPKEVMEVELVLKTSHDEYHAFNFTSVRDAIRYLLDLQVDIANATEILKDER